MSSDEVVQLLRTGRYAPPEWFLLEEVPPEKGALNRLDLVAWSLYASRGLTCEGVEVKTYRSDWLRELKKPAKAEATFAMVESFYICAPKDVVLEQEVPETWGWLEVQGSRVVRRKKAPWKQREPWTVEELAGVLRRILSIWIPRSMLAPEIFKARESAKGESEWHEKRADELRVELEKLREHVCQVDEVLGFDRWRSGEQWPERLERATQLRQLLDVLGDRPAQSVMATAVSTVSELLARSSAALQEAAELLRAYRPAETKTAAS